MDKQELRRTLKQHVGGAEFITATELATFLGYSKQNAKRVKSKYLADLQAIDKKYFIPEVAEQIMKGVTN
jgi:hypothetical protein